MKKEMKKTLSIKEKHFLIANSSLLNTLAQDYFQKLENNKRVISNYNHTAIFTIILTPLNRAPSNCLNKLPPTNESMHVRLVRLVRLP